MNDETPDPAIKRAEWLTNHRAPIDWVILTIGEVETLKRELTTALRERDEARTWRAEAEGMKRARCPSCGNTTLRLGSDGPSDGEGTSGDEVFQLVQRNVAALRKERDALREDKARLDWLEKEAAESCTGISLDSHKNKEEHEPRVWRFMRHHFLGPFCPSLRAAIDAALQPKEGK